MPKNEEPPKPPTPDTAWNALSLRRSPPIQLVPLSQIECPLWMSEPDPVFTQMYFEFLDGRRSVYVTRMVLGGLKCGFYRTASGGAQKFHCDQPGPEDIARLARAIRQGYRLPIFIYRNPNESDVERYLEVVDEISSAALTPDETTRLIEQIARET